MRFDYDEDARLIVASIGHGAGAFTETWTLRAARAHLEELALVISLAAADRVAPELPTRSLYTFPDATDPEWVGKWAAKMKATPGYVCTNSYGDTLRVYYRGVHVLSVDGDAFDIIIQELTPSERTDLWATLHGQANQRSSRTKVAR